MREKWRHLSILLFLIALCLCIHKPSFAVTRGERYQEMIDIAASQGEGPKGPQIKRPDVTYQAGGLRDPFKQYMPQAPKTVTARKGASEQTVINTLEVQGIIWGGNFPQAIVNDKIVKVGDTIGGASVVEINAEGVSLFLDNNIYKISSPAAKERQGSNPLSKEKKGGNK